MSPSAITAACSGRELRPLASALRVAATSVLVAMLIGASLVAAWHRLGIAPALMLAGSIGSIGLAGAVVLYYVRLRDAEAIYRIIVDASQDGICIVDDRAAITFANARFAEMLGYTADELLGDSIRTHVIAGDDTAFNRRFAGRGNGERHAQHEVRLVRSDGSELHVLANTSALLGRGRLSGLLCMITDLTPRKAAEAATREEEVRRALQQALDNAGAGAELANAHTGELAARLAAINEELQTFTYSVSHDLRAPLRVIDGFARELQLDPDSQLSAYGSRSVERIRTASWRMTALIDGLLDLTRASRTPLQRRSVDLSALGYAIASELAEVHSARAITFEIDDGLQASGDPRLLRSLLENLLGNAVKFTGRNETANIAFGLCDDGVTFFVRDDGSGFDPRSAANLFIPFQRLHSSSEFDGSGIGLATVRRIVQRHGGRVYAESAPGRGATFFFTLGINQGGCP